MMNKKMKANVKAKPGMAKGAAAKKAGMAKGKPMAYAKGGKAKKK